MSVRAKWIEPGDLAREAHGKLTPDLVERVCARHAAGEFIEHACEAESVGRETFRRWRNEHEWVAAAYGRAHAAGVKARLAEVELQASAREHLELLRAFDRDVFSPLQRVEAKNEHTGKDGVPLVPQRVLSNEEQRVELLRLLAMVDETADDVAKIRKGE